MPGFITTTSCALDCPEHWLEAERRNLTSNAFRLGHFCRALVKEKSFSCDARPPARVGPADDRQRESSALAPRWVLLSVPCRPGTQAVEVRYFLRGGKQRGHLPVTGRTTVFEYDVT